MTAPSTNVPAISWGPNGIVLPAETAILAGVQADMTAAFASQGVLNFTTTSGGITNPTSAGQLSNSQTAILGNTNASLAALAAGVDPAFSSGRMQDAIGRIYFQPRIAATFTTLLITCTGTAGVVIPFGATIQDPSGYIYACTAAGTIPSGGSIPLYFANTLPGPLPVPNSVSIYQSINNWATVSVASGVLGSNVESRSAFETRRQQSVAANSNGMTASIQGLLLALSGVTSAYCTQNDTNTTAVIQGITLPANSLYVCVAGTASSASIAQTILSRKNPGCSYYTNGATTVSVQQTAGYQPPYPTYSVSYLPATNLQILVNVNIVNSVSVPSNATVLIQAAVQACFAGADGGQAVAIAASLLSSRIIQTITTPVINGTTNPYYLPWAQVLAVLIGSLNAPGATFTGSISGTTLTVSSVASGTIASGQTLMDATGNILTGTSISSGSGSSWTVSSSQTVISETMYGVTASLYKITPNLNQYPATSAPLVSLTLT